MIYVARNAWPTGGLIREADWRIRNFFWNSCFAMPVRAPRGWIRAEIVEMSPANGGIGAPNIKTELVVLAAMTVGGWALTTKPLQRATARIMQGLAGETNAHQLDGIHGQGTQGFVEHRETGSSRALRKEATINKQ
ncbi:hypothetical protein PC123_g20492 [Phytophthora cactorum]|nr:hypothetical protein PC123_g20492 [Phytophthora cactorum]